MVDVINIKNAPAGWANSPEYQYIGRPGQSMDGYFGNPFRLLEEDDRDKILLQYRNWFYQRLFADEEFRDRIEGLVNKTLVCFCKPRMCHGDIIAEYLASKNPQIWTWNLNAT